MGGASLQVDEWGLLYSIDKPTYTQARGGSLQERGSSGGVCGRGGGVLPKSPQTRETNITWMHTQMNDILVLTIYPSPLKPHTRPDI